MTTQKQYNVLKQSVRNTHVKVDLLNVNGVVLSSLEGIATGGSINISASSTYRRSGNITLILDKKYNLIPARDSKIWFDKRCAISIGIDDYLGETIWFNMGRFAIADVSISINHSEKTITLQLTDYMSFLDGTLGGELAHQINIPANNFAISEVIREILTDSELGKFSIEEIGINGSSELVPYDIEKPSGSTVYELVKELVDLYQGYSFYFDVNGYLIVEQIKDRTNDPIIERFDEEKSDVTISLGANMDFTNVRNSIYVWGDLLDDGEQITYTYKNKYSRLTIGDMNRITDMSEGDICYVKGVYQSYVWDDKKWHLLDFNVTEEFNIENIGEKILTVNEKNIINKNQAMLQGEYTLKERSSLLETVSLSMVPLYNLQVNNKIYVKSKEGIEGEYLTDDIAISFDLSSEMTVSGTKIYK